MKVIVEICRINRIFPKERRKKLLWSTDEEEMLEV